MVWAIGRCLCGLGGWKIMPNICHTSIKRRLHPPKERKINHGARCFETETVLHAPKTM